MKTSTNPSDTRTLNELVANYRREIIDEWRLMIALRRANPGCTVRFQRAAVSGPNADVTLVFIGFPSGHASVSAMPSHRLDQLRQGVTDAEALAAMASRVGCVSNDDIDEL
ncbi:MAG: hypothetical protein HS113_29230 [Verrucomicrobiales bacterium]|nr:hypothetical protein [Verrucomicrobiales bacterium]